jgi:hypothetical protein
LVPTTDQLAYAEANWTMRWLLRDSPKDPRFLLRKELQFKRITTAYDIVPLLHFRNEWRKLSLPRVDEDKERRGHREGQMTLNPPQRRFPF